MWWVLWALYKYTCTCIHPSSETLWKVVLQHYRGLQLVDVKRRESGPSKQSAVQWCDKAGSFRSVSCGVVVHRIIGRLLHQEKCALLIDTWCCNYRASQNRFVCTVLLIQLMARAVKASLTLLSWQYGIHSHLLAMATQWCRRHKVSYFSQRTNGQCALCIMTARTGTMIYEALFIFKQAPVIMVLRDTRSRMRLK